MRSHGVPSFLLLSVLVACLAGCAAPAHNMVSGVDSGRISGRVHGGQQPVSGALIQLYSAGTSGDQSSATPLLTKTVTTDQNGSFDITSAYSCPLPTSQVYLVATGGNPGFSNGTNNSSIALMAALGSCSALTPSTFISINELTTVGAIAALYPYAGSYASIGSGSSDAAQLTAAFSTAAEYVNVSTGAVPGPSLPANYYASSTEIATLGDILSACINSAGGIANDGSVCGTLFSLTKPPSAPAATDTIGAVLDLLHQPTTNVAALFALVPGVGAPFQPSLATAPPDWTLPILPIPSAPSFGLTAGTYYGTQSVSLTDATAGASIYYTVDGSDPTTSSYLYSAAIPVSTSETIKAVALVGGRAFSAAASAAYVINPPPASVTAAGGGGQSAQVSTAFALPLQVSVTDSGSLPVTGVTVAFTAAGATFSPSACTTDVHGVCSVSVNANSFIGTYTVTASTGSLSTSFTLTNTAPHSFAVTVLTDATTGVAANCADQNSGSQASNANCSLRDALVAATLNATSALPATITFAQTTPGTVTLTNGPLTIPSYTTIQGATSGAGSSLTNLITIDGNSATSIFTQAYNTQQSTINNLILTHGNAAGTGDASLGGAIMARGSLAVNNSTFSENQAGASGGAISNNGGNLTIFGSTFASNTAAGFGGAVDNFASGTVNISNSTFTRNTSTSQNGGAVYSSGTATIIASTITQNTAYLGGGVFNMGSMTLSNNIITNNSYTATSTSNPDCGGVGCAQLWAYVRIIQLTPTVNDTGSVTIAFKDSLGNTFSQTVAYGQYSSPASLASAFGPYFYYNTSGLDTTFITGQPAGPPNNDLLIITPANNATLNSFTFSHTGQSFSAEQVVIPNLLSVNNNISGVTTAQINLSPLGDNGGPTQTMAPLTGSVALCSISPSTATGTDQRGQPRTVLVGSSTCQDAGAVQTAQ